MANTDSNQYANITALPRTFADVPGSRSRMRTIRGTATVLAADIDADGDTVKLCRLPARAVVHAIKVAYTDLDTGTDVAFDVGLYDIDGNAKDEDVYGTAVTMQAATTSWTDVAFEARGIADHENHVYEDAGDSDDTNIEYDLVLTQTAAAAGAAAGSIYFVVEYTID